MEESIGYEDLFSAEEWDGLDIGEWSDPDDEPNLVFADVSPDGEVIEDAHRVTIYRGERALQDGEARFEVECERCGPVAGAETEQEAQTIGRLHETMVATLVEKWRVD